MITTQQRIVDIYACVRRILFSSKCLDEEFVDLKLESQNVWPALLACNPRNIDYSIPHGVRLNSLGPVSIPILSKLESHFEDRPYVPTDNFIITSFPNGSSLLHVLEIYKDAESALYSVNRYDDRFATQYKKLCDALSRVIGECYEVFNRGDWLARYYLICRIRDIVEANCPELYETYFKVDSAELIYYHFNELVDIHRFISSEPNLCELLVKTVREQKSTSSSEATEFDCYGRNSYMAEYIRL